MVPTGVYVKLNCITQSYMLTLPAGLCVIFDIHEAESQRARCRPAAGRYWYVPNSGLSKYRLTSYKAIFMMVQD